MMSLKILHLLSHLSETNASAMVESHHNKVAFLPEWYWLEEKPYFVHLIELLESKLFHETALKTFLTTTIYNIINHHCMKHYSDAPTEATSKVMRLEPKEVRLLCSLLETPVIPEQISEIITFLCLANKQNTETFISTLYFLLDELCGQLSVSIRLKQDTAQRGKLKQVLTIVYDMFESEYSTRMEARKDRQLVKTELLAAFKSLLECKSLQQLCRDCVESMCGLGICTEVLECFFIIYKITMDEGEARVAALADKHKKGHISALGDLSQPEKDKVLVE